MNTAFEAQSKVVAFPTAAGVPHAQAETAK